MLQIDVQECKKELSFGCFELVVLVVVCSDEERN